jgi:hypothetical protein
MTIKAYTQDWNYTEHWKVKYNKIQSSKTIKKLARHFKINIYTTFNTYKNGYANYNGKIELPTKNITLGMICHELGHILAYKNGHKGHNKKAYKYIHRIYKYAIKYIPIKLLLDIKTIPLLEYKGVELK